MVATNKFLFAGTVSANRFLHFLKHFTNDEYIAFPNFSGGSVAFELGEGMV